MAAPNVNLTVAGGGMTRLRTKGAAQQNSLYNLINGYVTMAQTVKVRPGTFRDFDLATSGGPSTTVGLTFYKDLFHVFSDAIADVPDGFISDVLTFPATQLGPLSYFVTDGTLKTSGSTVVGTNDEAGLVHEGAAAPDTPATGFVSATIGSFLTPGAVTPTTVDGTRLIYGLFYTCPSSISDPNTLYLITDAAWSPPSGTTLSYTAQGGGVNTFNINNGVISSALDLGDSYVAFAWSVAGKLPDFTQPVNITGAVGTAVPVKKIHFAAPFMGFLYVVAEFDVVDSAVLAQYGDTYHFWLQSNGPWTADTVYQPSDIVEPTVPNGLGYQATRLVAPNSLWAPNIAVTLNQIVEPNTPNGYMYQAIAVAGTNPATGAIEPTWPATIGATVQDFGDAPNPATSTASTGATVESPSTSITDRYGNPYAVGPDNSSGTVAPTVAASTNVTTWAPGVLTNPGTVVRPSTTQGAFINAIPNGGFENGDDGSWVLNDANVTIIDSAGLSYSGTYCLQFALTMETDYCTMATSGVVAPGQSVTATGYLNPNNSGSNMTMWLNLLWYDVSNTLISTVQSAPQQGVGYRKTTVTGTAPALATQVYVQIESSTGTHSIPGSYADNISWNLETPAAASPFLFEAIQTAVGTTAATQPTWPVVAGDTVTDGGVTWEAVGASIITWQALPIMESGDTEPTWPTTVGLAVADGNMGWVCVSRQITDTNCPQSQVVAIGQSKVFAIDDDIISFCATTNPLDWTSQFDAGYLPFGLQTYGSEPAASLGLYRSNLVATNSLGYQMWQIDPDPANMALLDAQPVGCTYPLSMQPVQNDLVFLTTRGIRSLGISGASGNVQAGQYGKNLDPLVLESLSTVTDTSFPLALFYPGTGQYWLGFGNTVYVQTNNGSGNANSWSMYEFPSSIDYWTISDGELYLRSGDLVWHVHEDALYDDIQDSSDPGSNSIPFTGTQSWQFLDLGTPGVDKTLEGLNITCTGTGTLSIGYDQSNFSLATTPFAFDGDTLPGIGMIPMPMTAPSFQVILTWDPGQAWEWDMTNVYINLGASS